MTDEPSRFPRPRRAESLGRAPDPAEGWYENLYHMLLGSMPFSVVLIDRGLKVASVNRNFLEKSRRNESNTIGRPMRDGFPGAIMEFARLEAKVHDVFDTGQPLQGEKLTYRAPGIADRIYYYTIVPVKSGDVVQQAMLVMDDITEKVHLSEKVRMAERHLASVVESANDLVVSTDHQGAIVSMNMAAQRISGYRADEVRGRALTDLCEPAQRKEMSAVMRRLAVGDVAKFQELNLAARDGSLIPVDWSFSPIRDDAAKFSGIVAVGRDLSERRAFEKHLFQSEKLAALGVMAGGIAHELRNPMSVSYSAVQFLQDPAIEPGFQRDCVKKIMHGIEQASSIIENLLRFARPSPSDRMAPIDLKALVRETVLVLMPQAKLHKIRMREDYPEAVLPIFGNGNLLQQVMMNLILNAFHATAPGGEVRVILYFEQAEALLSVCDTGRGISPGDLPKIFDPFFTTQPVGQGTGLGLSICHTIIKQHGGSISVESTEGLGSTFTIRLPVSADSKVTW